MGVFLAICTHLCGISTAIPVATFMQRERVREQGAWVGVGGGYNARDTQKGPFPQAMAQSPLQAA